MTMTPERSRTTHRGERTGPQLIMRHPGARVAERGSWWPAILTAVLGLVGALLLTYVLWQLSVAWADSVTPSPSPAPPPVVSCLDPVTVTDAHRAMP